MCGNEHAVGVVFESVFPLEGALSSSSSSSRVSLAPNRSTSFNSVNEKDTVIVLDGDVIHTEPSKWVDGKHGLYDYSHFVDMPDVNGETALHLAIARGHKRIISLLIKYGANTRYRAH